MKLNHMKREECDNQIGKRLEGWNSLSKLAFTMFVVILAVVALIPKPVSNCVAVGVITAATVTSAFMLISLVLRSYWALRLTNKRVTGVGADQLHKPSK